MFVLVREAKPFQKTKDSNLGASISGLGTQLVDLRLSDVSSLLGLVQLVLLLAELAEMNIGLLLLFWMNEIGM